MEHRRKSLLIIALTVCAFAGIITFGIILTACYRQEETYVTFETVNALRTASVGDEGEKGIKLGDTVQTRGYHTANDSGSGLYEIVSGDDLKDNGGTIIKLSDGHFAKLKFGVDNSVNIMQFGARGDGETDDLPAFQAAMSAETGASVVIFPEKKDFVMGRNFIITRDDLEIRGNNSTLVINNSSYNETISPEWYSWEFFIYILNSTNITIDGLNVSSTHTVGIGRNRYPQNNEPDSRYNYATQLCVMSSTGIDILNCRFTSVNIPGIGGHNNVDLYKDWHDVRIAGCTFTLTSDTELGTCLMARNLETEWTAGATSSDNLLIENNTFYKITHDEILWICGTRADISGITVRKNKFKMVKSETSTLTPHAISVIGDGYSEGNVGYSAEDVTIEDNEFDIVGGVSLFNLGGNLTNVLIKNNKGTFTVSTNNGSIVTAIVCRNAGRGVKTNVVLEENNITVKTDHERSGNLVFAECSASFINNNITLDCDVTDIFSSMALEARDNTVQVNGNVTESVSAGNRLFVNNTVNVTGYIQRCLEVMIPAMAADIVFEENHIEADSTVRTGYTHFLIVSTMMSNYKIQMAGNTIIAPEPLVGNPKNFLYWLNIKDTTAQSINISLSNTIPSHYSTRAIASDKDLIIITSNP